MKLGELLRGAGHWQQRREESSETEEHARLARDRGAPRRLKVRCESGSRSLHISGKKPSGQSHRCSVLDFSVLVIGEKK